MPSIKVIIMEQDRALNVAIVGGGPGCKMIMDMIFAERLHEVRMKLIGVASTNPEAVGYLFAKKKGIYTMDKTLITYGDSERENVCRYIRSFRVFLYVGKYGCHLVV